MNKKLLGLCLLIAVILLLSVALLYGNNFALLNPQGVIALKQRNLLAISTLIISFLILPTLFLILYFAWKYSAKNAKAKYLPDWQGDGKLQALLWLIPISVVSLLALIIWQSSHDLDPFKPLSAQSPTTIQVVALRWKWLFIYPEENIASVNFVQFPVDKPVVFELTSDGPMNSFWIPQIGGQMYAMTGMKTRLNLMASQQGEFAGSAAEINGQGFAGMKFVAKASSDIAFELWVSMVAQSQNILTQSSYEELARPSENNQVEYFSWQDDMFENVLEKYNSHGESH